MLVIPEAGRDHARDDHPQVLVPDPAFTRNIPC